MIKLLREKLCSFLVADNTWIGNSDRHHENWGFVELDKKLYLAPTYDHASCLGRNEPDQIRSARLRTQDRGYSVEAYADKCQSYLYVRIGNKKRLKTFEAFCEAAKLYPQAACIWLDRLESISFVRVASALPNRTLELLERIPDRRISLMAIEFAHRILTHNQNQLLKFREQL